MPPSAELRWKVVALYKELLHLGKAYPRGYENYFRPKVRAAFRKNAGLPEGEIGRAIERGKFVVGEIEALYYLKKYRTLRQRYGSQDGEG